MVLSSVDSLSQSVVEYLRRDFVSVRPAWTVNDCLESLRGEQDTGGIYYIYVTKEDGRLIGVIPIRRMLAVDPATRAEDIMITRLVTLPDSATVFDACELFIFHKFLAIPIVDTDRRLVGIVDVNVFTDEMVDMGERQQVDDVFQWMGVKMEVLGSASPLQAFRYRFPWLGATMASGVGCAIIAGMYEQTLANAAILAMFLTVALGLGESVSIQSMTMTLQALTGHRNMREFIKGRLVREILTATLLAVACGAIIGLISILWPGALLLSLSIGGSIAVAVIVAGLVGLAVPTILHCFNWDPKVAAGPITLALADLSTVFLYLSAATLALRAG